MTKYDIIFEELQDRVDTGKLTLEDAQILNDLAYEKYVTEFKVDIQSELVNDRLQQKYRSERGIKKRPSKDSFFYQDNLHYYDHGDNRWKDNLKPQRKSGLHQDQQLYGDDPKTAFTADKKRAWDEGRGEDVKRRSEDIDRNTERRLNDLHRAVDTGESLKRMKGMDFSGNRDIDRMGREMRKDYEQRLTVNSKDSKALKKLKRQIKPQ